MPPPQLLLTELIAAFERVHKPVRCVRFAVALGVNKTTLSSSTIREQRRVRKPRSEARRGPKARQDSAK